MATETRAVIATLVEDVRFTTGGALALIGLALFQLGVVLAFGGMKSAVQEASLGTVWIAINILLGIGVINGRRRTYRVLRDVNPN